MVDAQNINDVIRVSASTSTVNNAVEASNDKSKYYEELSEAYSEKSKEYSEEAKDYSDLAKDWATKTDDTVDGEEYSSKYYAESVISTVSTAEAQIISTGEAQEAKLEDKYSELGSALESQEAKLESALEDKESALESTLESTLPSLEEKIVEDIQPSVESAKESAESASTSATSANTSKLRCEEILDKLGTAIKIKGRVDTFADLPTTGNLDGDAYLVGEDGLTSYPEYYWYSNHWEFLGTSGGGGTWGTLTGDITTQTDLMNKFNAKQDTLTAGDNITIENNVISASGGGASYEYYQEDTENETASIVVDETYGLNISKSDGIYLGGTNNKGITVSSEGIHLLNDNNIGIELDTNAFSLTLEDNIGGIIMDDDGVIIATDTSTLTLGGANGVSIGTSSDGKITIENNILTISDFATYNTPFQLAISDLDTIRTNSTNGNTAYTTIQGYGDIVTHNASEFIKSVTVTYDATNRELTIGGE